MQSIFFFYSFNNKLRKTILKSVSWLGLDPSLLTDAQEQKFKRNMYIKIKHKHKNKTKTQKQKKSSNQAKTSNQVDKVVFKQIYNIKISSTKRGKQVFVAHGCITMNNSSGTFVITSMS